MEDVSQFLNVEEQTQQQSAQHINVALVNISKALLRSGISKNAQCGGSYGGFAYRSITDFYAALAPALVANGVTVRTIKETIVSNDHVPCGKPRNDGTQNVMRFVTLLCVYELVDQVDGSRCVIESLGEGADLSDKAIGKAKSYCYKTAMEKLFCIPLQGQYDSDSEVLPVSTPIATVDASTLKDAEQAASNGIEAYQSFWQSLNVEDRKALAQSGEHSKLKKLASEV